MEVTQSIEYAGPLYPLDHLDRSLRSIGADIFTSTRVEGARLRLNCAYYTCPLSHPHRVDPFRARLSHPC